MRKLLNIGGWEREEVGLRNGRESQGELVHVRKGELPVQMYR